MGNIFGCPRCVCAMQQRTLNYVYALVLLLTEMRFKFEGIYTSDPHMLRVLYIFIGVLTVFQQCFLDPF